MASANALQCGNYLDYSAGALIARRVPVPKAKMLPCIPNQRLIPIVPDS